MRTVQTYCLLIEPCGKKISRTVISPTEPRLLRMLTMNKDENFNSWYTVVISALVLEIILFYLFTHYFA
jgi:hypothetical protein